MNSPRWLIAALLVGISAIPRPAQARALSIEVRTDRGGEAVYQPGEALEIQARISEDAYLLLYEIDAEGYVHVLFPYRYGSGYVEGGRRHRFPSRDSDYELVVQEPVGQAFIVAIASLDGFRELPWYLRPYNAQAEEIGYHDRPSRREDEGVTEEGRVVGDPFVAMERIRRRVLDDPDDPSSFATAYTSYYVHHEVRYPRYVCYDCHRPSRWAWWDGFDPYYTRCSVFDFRVNWAWAWGPRYWYGVVPYYVYVYRYDCPPRYRGHYSRGLWHSSWDGWRRWDQLWGGPLRRYKSPPPKGYVGPSKDPSRQLRSGGPVPPGYLAGGAGGGRVREPRVLPTRRPGDPSGPDRGEKRQWNDRLRERGRREPSIDPGRKGDAPAPSRDLERRERRERPSMRRDPREPSGNSGGARVLRDARWPGRGVREHDPIRVAPPRGGAREAPPVIRSQVGKGYDAPRSVRVGRPVPGPRTEPMRVAPRQAQERPSPPAVQRPEPQRSGRGVRKQAR